jgi:anti-anti-sigma factor
VAVFTAQGIISFHSAAAFEYEFQGRDSRPLVIRMKNVHHVDSSGLLTLEGIIEHRHRQGGRTMLSAVNPEVLPVLERFGIIAAIGRENVFAGTAEAIASCAPPLRDHDAEPLPPHSLSEALAH